MQVTDKLFGAPYGWLTWRDSIDVAGADLSLREQRVSRSRSRNPVVERRRARAMQFSLLAVLASVTLVLVYLAMTTNG